MKARGLSNYALVVVDAQRGFDDRSWGARNNPVCDENITALVECWRAEAWTVVYVRDDSTDPLSPLHPGSPGTGSRTTCPRLPTCS